MEDALHCALRGEDTVRFSCLASDPLLYWDPFEMGGCSLPASAGAQCQNITGPHSGVELGVALVLRIKFSPWGVVEFLISAGINSSSPVVCVFQEMEFRFLLAV